MKSQRNHEDIKIQLIYLQNCGRMHPCRYHHIIRAVGKVTLQRAHPARGQAANLAKEKCEAGVHVRIKRRRIPIHTEYFHTGGATNLSLVVKRANAVGSSVMRSETSWNILCSLTTRHWRTIPCESARHTSLARTSTTTPRPQGVVSTVQKVRILFQCLLHGAIFFTHTGNHSTENESQDFHRNSREKMSTGYLRAFQEFSNASEDATRTGAALVASVNEPKRTATIPAMSPTASPAIHAGVRFVVLLRTVLEKNRKGSTDSGRFRGNTTSHSAERSNG